MRAPDQYVSSHIVKQGVGFKAPSVFVDLRRIAVAQLRIVSFKVSAYFLARLLEADGAVGLLVTPQVPSTATRMYSCTFAT